MDPLKIIPLSEKYVVIVFKNAGETSKKDKFQAIKVNFHSSAALPSCFLLSDLYQFKTTSYSTISPPYYFRLYMTHVIFL